MCEALLKRFEQADAALSSPYKEDVPGLQLLGSAIDDLEANAHLDRPSDLEEYATLVGRYLDCIDLGLPLPTLTFTGEAVHGSLLAEVEPAEVEESRELIEGIGLDDDLGAADYDDRSF